MKNKVALIFFIGQIILVNCNYTIAKKEQVHLGSKSELIGVWYQTVQSVDDDDDVDNMSGPVSRLINFQKDETLICIVVMYKNDIKKREVGKWIVSNDTLIIKKEKELLKFGYKVFGDRLRIKLLDKRDYSIFIQNLLIGEWERVKAITE